MITSAIFSLLAFAFGSSLSMFSMRKYFASSMQLEGQLESLKSESESLGKQITYYKNAIKTLQEEKDRFKAIAYSHDIKIENNTAKKVEKKFGII